MTNESKIRLLHRVRAEIASLASYMGLDSVLTLRFKNYFHLLSQTFVYACMHTKFNKCSQLVQCHYLMVIVAPFCHLNVQKFS